MRSIVLVLACILAVAVANPEARFKFFEYCKYHDYPVEDHVIPTDDHYNLQFYRIQGKHVINQLRILTLFLAKESYIFNMDWLIVLIPGLSMTNLWLLLFIWQIKDSTYGSATAEEIATATIRWVQRFWTSGTSPSTRWLSTICLQLFVTLIA